MPPSPCDLSPLAVRTWRIVISGFTQKLDAPNGSELLWLKLSALDEPGVRTEHWTWDSDWSAVAEKIWRLRPHGGPSPAVHVCAYSWGGGWGFPRLARELGKRGLAVETAVLSDPVYRHPLWSLAWLSLVRFPRVVVPPNVKAVWWFFQRFGLPGGHQVVAADPDLTNVRAGLEARCIHHYMDALPSYHSLAMKIAQGNLRCCAGAKCG